MPGQSYGGKLCAVLSPPQRQRVQLGALLIRVCIYNNIVGVNTKITFKPMQTFLVMIEDFIKVLISI
jgi:hypothetical protein